jgi:hypothetical protein
MPLGFSRAVILEGGSFIGSGGTESSIVYDSVDYTVHTFDYTGADQSFTVQGFGGTGLAYVTVFGAGGGAGNSYNTPYGGSGGYGFAKLNFRAAQTNDFTVVVGQGGTRNTVGSRTIYGHFGNSVHNLPGGFGSNAGNGGGLSGIFGGNTVAHANSLAISGGGGGSGQISGNQTYGAGGPGGGFNQNGTQGYDNNRGTNTHGRGGTLAAGGNSGIVYYRHPNGQGRNSIAVSGKELFGGHAHTANSWTEGGGGGSGYYGGGSGAHEDAGGYWAAAGGGSGYLDLTKGTVLNAVTSNYQSQDSQVTGDQFHSGSIGQYGRNSDGGNGRVVIWYPTSQALY